VYTPNPQPKAYGLYATTSYIYLATSKNMVRILNPNLSDAGYFDVGNDIGDTVYVSGSVGYATSGTTLYACNLAGSLNPAPQLATTTIAGTSKRIIVVGNYLYVATSSTTKQLQIFDITNVGTGTISFVGELNTGNNQSGIDVYVKSGGDYAYLVTGDASPDFVGSISKNAQLRWDVYHAQYGPRPLIIPQDNRASCRFRDRYLSGLRINIPSAVAVAVHLLSRALPLLMRSLLLPGR
jgi:hypothetical protein